MIDAPLVKLGDIFTIARGGSPRPIQQYISDAPDAVNWISIKDATNSSKYIRTTKLKISRNGISKSRLVGPGDFLLTNSMSFGRPYIMATTGCIHDGWLVLSSNHDKIDQDYFFHLLGSKFMYAKFARLAAGAVVKNLNIGLVRGVKVPLPPLTEQRRIAAILDKADAIRRKRRAALALTEDLLRSAFLDLFGDPVTNPKGWPVIKLEETFSHKPQIGTTKPAHENGDHLVIRVGEIGSRNVALSRCGSLNLASKEFEKYRCLPGDYFLARAIGSEAHLGKSSILQAQIRTVVFDSHVMRLRFSDECLSPHFFDQWMRSKGGRSLFMRQAGRTAVQFNVNAEQISRVKLPLPPKRLQNRFTKLQHRVRMSQDKKETAVKEADDLFHALVQRTFRGDL